MFNHRCSLEFGLMRGSRITAAILIATAVAACDKEIPSTPEARPVRTVTIERGAEGEIVSLTGQIRAKDHTNLAFRLDGRMIERPVESGPGASLGPGQPCFG